MREIKFRAWATEVKEMVSDVFFDNLEVSVWGEDGELEIVGDRIPNRLLQYCILMQFTGLKDKNGKEIYEGDICSMKSFDTYVKGEVRYQPPEFCLRTANDYWELDYGDPAYIEIKIIGNIYENPELL